MEGNSKTAVKVVIISSILFFVYRYISIERRRRREHLKVLWLTHHTRIMTGLAFVENIILRKLRVYEDENLVKASPETFGMDVETYEKDWIEFKTRNQELYDSCFRRLLDLDERLKNNPGSIEDVEKEGKDVVRDVDSLIHDCLDRAKQRGLMM